MSAPPPPEGQPSGKRARAPQPDPWGAFSLLLSGLIFWGGVGWLVARLTGQQGFLPAGMLLGVGAALYLVWLRYGKP